MLGTVIAITILVLGTLSLIGFCLALGSLFSGIAQKITS